MMDEVELKLELRREDADALELSGLLTGRPVIADQRSIYFDTPDRALADAGLSLRIRSTGAEKIQTVKASGASAAGLFVRAEWERPVSDDMPVMDDTTPIKAILGDATAHLVPAFEIDIERRNWNLLEAGSVIEISLDRGQALAGDRLTSICEIELELKHGGASGLFDFARKIDAIVPVRVGVLTKAERGYNLIEPIATVHKATRINLDSSMTAAQAFQHLIQSCVRHFRLNEAILLEERQPEALHQARVALRRLRSAFTIFKELADKDSARLRAELRWLASELGTARDLDVLLERVMPGGALHDRLDAAADAAYRQVVTILASPRVRGLILDLAQWTTGGAWLTAAPTSVARDRSVRHFADNRLQHFRRRLKNGGKNLKRADDADRHEVRKDAKKLRYAVEFFASLYAEKVQRRRHKRYVVAVEALQDALGALNDLATAPQLLSRLGLASDPAAAGLIGQGDKLALLEVADQAYGDMVDTKRFWL